MKTFIRKRFKELGITQVTFMQRIGLKRDFYSKRNTMERKFNDLNKFFKHLNCEVIIVKRKMLESDDYEKVYPEDD